MNDLEIEVSNKLFELSKYHHIQPRPLITFAHGDMLYRLDYIYINGINNVAVYNMSNKSKKLITVPYLRPMFGEMVKTLANAIDFEEKTIESQEV
jgi:hypothetical protein